MPEMFKEKLLNLGVISPSMVSKADTCDWSISPKNRRVMCNWFGSVHLMQSRDNFFFNWLWLIAIAARRLAGRFIAMNVLTKGSFIFVKRFQ